MMTALPIGVVGKLPARADFVRLGARGDAFEELLGWLVDGAERAALCERAALAALARDDVRAFVYRASGGQLLVGALAPSCDGAGRNLPVAAAVELPLPAALGRHVEVLPILLEPVWEGTRALVLELQDVPAQASAGSGWSVEWSANLEAAFATYAQWTEEMPIEDLVELVFGADLQVAAHTLAWLEEAIAPYRGIEAPETPLSLRLPLGAAGGAAVCFWLDFIRRSLAWRRTVPSFFWSHDGETGALMLHLGTVPEVALAELWLPSGEHDEICDWASAEARSWQSDRTAAWAALLDAPGHSLVGLLEAADLGG